MDAIGAALDLQRPGVEAIGQALAARGRSVIVLDGYENFGLVDAWLRQTFLPAMPEHLLTVIAGREAPSPGWATAPGWQAMFREIRLGALGDTEARAMLEQRGVDAAQAARITRFARGYPLALELAAAAVRTQPDLDIEGAALPEILGRLTETLLSGLPRTTVDALRAAASVRRVTEPLLAALLGVESARAPFDELRGMSFVSQRAHGMYLHDVVRDAIALETAQRDPQTNDRYRERAWRFLSAASHRADTASLWHHTADLLYLVRNPNVRNAFFCPGAVEASLEHPSPADGAGIEAIAGLHEPPAGAAWLQRWWHRHPETFKVARTSDDALAGFYLIFERQDVDQNLLREDPVTAAWCAHLDAHPLAPGERALLCRRWLSRADGEALGVVQAASWLDIKRLYMEMRPHLRRIYCPVNDIAAYAPVVTPLGFKPVEEAHVDVDGVTYYTAMLDFGPESVDGSLRGLIGAELQSAESAAPRATVRTVLFTDLVGHTAMLQRLGDAAGRRLLREHEELSRRLFREHGGDEIKNTGDGFMAAFASVTAAIDCAIALQRAIRDRNLGATEPLAVRVGLNAGEPIAEDGDLFGSSVVLAARIAAQADAGEILIPEPLRHLLAGKQYEYADRGIASLKGFEDGFRLYEVRWAD